MWRIYATPVVTDSGKKTTRTPVRLPRRRISSSFPPPGGATHPVFFTDRLRCGVSYTSRPPPAAGGEPDAFSASSKRPRGRGRTSSIFHRRLLLPPPRAPSPACESTGWRRAFNLPARRPVARTLVWPPVTRWRSGLHRSTSAAGDSSKITSDHYIRLYVWCILFRLDYHVRTRQTLS